jgi:two-component system chemotaxis sensor kinase CheA
MSNPNNDFLSKLIATFRLEADEHLQAIISGLLALEKATTADEQAPTLEVIFREAHSLKGAARAVNLTEVEALCQALEGVFARLKRRELQLASEDFDTVHRALDTVNALLAEPDQPHAAEVAEAVQELARLETALPTAASPQEAATAQIQSSEKLASHAALTGAGHPNSTTTTSYPTTPAGSLSSPVTPSSATVSPTYEIHTPECLPQASPPNTPQVVGANPVNGFLAKLVATFRLEADEHLKVMVAGLLALEKASVADERQSLLETLFREAHSLKGAARAVDLIDVEAVCQALEGVLVRLRRGEFRLSAEGFDAIHQSLDTIEVLLSEPNQPHATQIAEAVQRLTRLETAGDPDLAKPNVTPQVVSLTQGMTNSSTSHYETEGSQPSSPLSFVPPLPQTEQPTTRRTSLPPASPPQVDERGEQPAPQQKQATEETVRVTAAKLDSLFLQVEEMLSAKLSVNQYALDLKETLGILTEWRKEWAKVSAEIRKLQRLIEAKEDWIRQGAAYSQAVPSLVNFLYWNEQQFLALEARIKGLAKAAEHDQQAVGALIDSLLENTKRVLMMPFSSLLEIFPKMVRDLSRSLGKEVEFLIRGNDVEIDKRILEELKTPLIHLIRNSLDHGIETPEVRAGYEKSSRGTIIITVSQTSGSSVEILISDDGGGIDCRKVTAAAVKKGFLSSEAAEKLDEQAALALIFQSEVSTSPIVTDISGRGLGMAIVREKIEKLGGQIAVETHLHEGTSFRIVVPLTLATFRGVFVETAGRTFVIPTGSIERVARLKWSDVKTIDGKETLFLDGRPIVFVRLDALLQLPRAIVHHADEDTLLTVILSAADKQIACCVDEVENEQEVLFKSLGAFLSHVPNVAGATVLGSGKVIPILHVPDLLACAIENRGARTVTLTADKDSEARAKSVLIAEDSVTSRMLLKGILESAGYQVTTAVDGMDAFSLLQKAHFDLLVSDVEMPRMNGFELTAKVRSTKPLAQVPVVLVTGLDSRDDRERGITAGADAYIVKTSFDQSNLLDVVQRLI